MIVIGLGNPGEKYERTRHNAGRFVLECISKKNNSEFEYDGFLDAKVATVEYQKKVHTIVLPETYMNDSGKTARALQKKGIDKKNIVIVYDDLDIPLGSLKVSFARSSGGHNGVQSIIQVLGIDCIRIRIGIAPVDETGALAKRTPEHKGQNYVMAPLTTREQNVLEDLSLTIFKCINSIEEEGLQKAMTIFNA